MLCASLPPTAELLQLRHSVIDHAGKPNQVKEDMLFVLKGNRSGSGHVSGISPRPTPGGTSEPALRIPRHPLRRQARPRVKPVSRIAGLRSRREVRRCSLRAGCGPGVEDASACAAECTKRPAVACVGVVVRSVNGIRQNAQVTPSWCTSDMTRIVVSLPFSSVGVHEAKPIRCPAVNGLD